MELDTSRIRGIVVAVAFGLGALELVHPLGRSGPVHLFFYDGLAAAGGAALLVAGFVLLRRKRVLENVPESRIRSVAMGFAELEGIAQKKCDLVAPHSGIPCVYYRYLVEQEKSSGRGGRSWKTVERGESSEPFYLHDPTGTILVDPSGAQATLRQSYRNIEREGGWLSYRKRYTEWWIVQGQRLFVAGTVRRLRDVAQERRVALNERLRALKHDPTRLHTFDTDHDGQISTEEWGNAVRAVQDEVLSEQVAPQPAPKPEDDVMIGKGSGETTFIIADRSEKSLVGLLSLEAGAALAGGAGLVLVFTVSLLARAGLLKGGWVVPW